MLGALRASKFGSQADVTTFEQWQNRFVCSYTSTSNTPQQTTEDYTQNQSWCCEYQDGAVVLTAQYKHANEVQSSVRVESTIALDQIFEVAPNEIKACANQGANRPPATYCKDVLETILPLKETLGEERRDIPVLMMLGDRVKASAFPMIQQVRTTGILPCNDSQASKMPKLWKLNTFRHYRCLEHVAHFDMNWDDKLPFAIFRGAASGMAKHQQRDTVTLRKTCRQNLRCNFVYQHSNSTLVDAKLTNLNGLELN